MKKRIGIGVGMVAWALVQGVAAEQFAFVGARAMGMGGANAASVHDATAQWHNPGAFGFMYYKTNEVDNGEMESMERAYEVADPDTVSGVVMDNDLVYDVELSSYPGGEEPEYKQFDNNGLGDRIFGWNVVGVGAGYTMTEDMGHYLGMVDDIDFDLFDGEGGLSTDPESVKSMLAIGSTLFGMEEDGSAVYADVSAGTSMRIGHFAIGVRMFGEATAYVDDVDDNNFGIDQDATGFVDTINNDIAPNYPGFNAGSHILGSLSFDQRNDLVASFVGGGAAQADAENAADYIDYQLGEMVNDGTINQGDIDNAFELIDSITFGVDPSDANSLENNRSFMVGRAFGVVEVPVSYGWAINENFSIGATVKGMYGTVSGSKVWFFDDDATEDAFDAASDNTEASLNFGLDLGALYRIKNFQFALVGHNLNAPKFDGFTDTISIEDDLGNELFTEEINIPDVKIDPQITVGAAFIPSERFCLETSFDLLETGTLLDGYDIQRLSFGGELDVWLLALRLGAYKNLAADWQDWVATAGIGLNVYLCRLDIGGAYSLGDNATYDGTEIPTEARLYAELSIDF